MAIVTDGTAVLGLGDIGPQAALPVMEGKSLLFKELADVDAFPVCLATKDVDEIVRDGQAHRARATAGSTSRTSPRRAASRSRSACGEELDMPVFHDDQHGTAVVVLAALLNALRIVGKELADISVVVCGVGAAGTATIRILRSVGVRRILGVDEHGILAIGRPAPLDAMKARVAQETNPEGRQGR